MGREDAHVDSELGDEFLRAMSTQPGQAADEVPGRGEALPFDQFVDPPVEPVDVGAGLIDPVQPESDHEPVVIVEPAG